MEEQIDILDSRGNRTGEVRSKKEVHLRGDWHRTVHAWFLNSQNELLIQRRSRNIETSPGMWDISAAGHISAGQSSVGAAQREILEEIGIEIEPTELIPVATVVSESVHQGGSYINREFQDVYLIKKDLPISSLRLQESEVEEVRYISLDEFESWIREKKPDLVVHAQEYEKLLSFLKK